MTHSKKSRKKNLPKSHKKHEQPEEPSTHTIHNTSLLELPESKFSLHDLSKYFEAAQSTLVHILPLERRRYVIYLRKSTDDEAKQVRSLKDQLAECLRLASNLGITVHEDDIFEESASAKRSGNRPTFDKMLAGFREKKYHGLIVWSPDRLSRNMKEAGEIIEMIDHEEIQDLIMPTYPFENTPTGKMLLGMLFATSKQYSDKLAVDVKRGNDGNIKEGRYNGATKKGYYVDNTTGYFMPDGQSWELLRKAAVMCLYEGKTRIEAVEFLNQAKFAARKDQDEPLKAVKMTKQTLTKLFADPFYSGLYQYGDSIAILPELYNFTALLTTDEYIALNKDIASDFSIEAVTKVAAPKRLEYGLLRNKVICDFCDTTMQFQHQKVGRGRNKGKWLVSYYCRNKSCMRHNPSSGLKKSIRAKYIMAAIEYTMRHMNQKSKKAYKRYVDIVQAEIAHEHAIARRNLQAARVSLRKNEREFAKYRQLQIDKPRQYDKFHNGKLEEYDRLIKIDELNVEKHEKKLAEKEKMPSEQDFYELIDSHLLRLLKTNDFMEQDVICNEYVSNLRAGDDSVSVIKLNPPYDLLVDLTKVSSGGRRGTRTLKAYSANGF